MKKLFNFPAVSYNGSVAQLAEQWTFNPLVEGSSPSRPTNLRIKMNNQYKYPSTPHLPWSPGTQSDDKKLSSVDHFHGKEVYITEKLDGENTTIYSDGIHARSLDSPTNFTRSWVQQFHSSIAHNIPKGWRIVGENVWAEHSIRYDNLASYFYPFAVYNDENYCLSYNDMIIFLRTQIFKDLECKWTHPVTPPLLYKNIFDAYAIQSIEIDPDRQEGYVLRTLEGFHYDDFQNHVAKYVRENHVQTDEYWLKNAKQNGELK